MTSSFALPTSLSELPRASSIIAFLAGVAILLTIHACLYRLLFHPFAKYPGPLLAKVSKAYSAYHALKRDTHVEILRLHEKHGPVVRYGPDRLLFNTREALEDIYGRDRNFFKGRAYDGMRIQPVPSVFNVASNRVHAQRRRIIAHSFTDLALKGCEPVIIKHAAEYSDVLFGGPVDGAGWSEAKDVTHWSAYLAIDLIADLTVGRSTEMLISPKNRVYNVARKANFRRMGLAMQWPEAFLNKMLPSVKIGEMLLPQIAKLGKEWHQLLSSWIEDRIRELKEVKDRPESQADMITPLLKPNPDTGETLTDAEVFAEMTTLLIAGSGTITTGVSSLIWYLSRHSDAYEQVVSEIRSTFKSLEEIRIGAKLNSCIYLRACFQEASRVSPAPTTPLYREAGPKGASVSGIRVPQGCEAAVSIYALHHNEMYYPDSFVFDPERWIGNSAAVQLARSAWAPFSHGPRNCVGANLATFEVMMIVSTLLWQGDFRISDDSALAGIGAGGPELGPGRTRKGEFQMYDTFGALTDGPFLQFRLRAGSRSRR